MRFAGFEGEWEEKKFGKVIQRKSKSSANNSLPRVEYEDIIPEIGKLNKDINSKSSIKKGIYFESDDVLFGKLRPYLKNYLNPQFEGIAVGDFWILNNKSGDNSFLFYYLQIPQFQYIANTSIGTKMPRSDWNLVSGSKFIYPSNNEQEKIGDLFRKIDALIEKQEGKVSKMEDFKKSMLQKIFPKKGELVPEFRFDGFDGEWEKKKISDIGKISAGGDIDKKKISNKGRYPVIANGDSNNGIIGYYEDHYKISEPAVTISARGNIGTAVARNYPFTPVIRVLTLISDNNIYFMSEAINRLRIFNESSGVPQLTSPQFGGYDIFMTKLSEQEKIGQFFKNLDTQIETEEKLLESYKQMKKSLLQKMFV